MIKRAVHSNHDLSICFKGSGEKVSSSCFFLISFQERQELTENS